jgi:hypothetical protein
MFQTFYLFLFLHLCLHTVWAGADSGLRIAFFLFFFTSPKVERRKLVSGEGNPF